MKYHYTTFSKNDSEKDVGVKFSKLMLMKGKQSVVSIVFSNLICNNCNKSEMEPYILNIKKIRCKPLDYCF